MNNIKFINDKVVKKVLNSERKENREYLVRMISEITKIDINLLRNNLNMINNEISTNKDVVDSKVDAIYKDDNNYINIEINYNYSRVLTVKNNIYLYNMILRQVHNNENYKSIMPAIQININGYDLFKKGNFIYKSQMMEEKHNIVRDEMLSIYDINLEYLRKIDYNKFKKGNDYNLEKLLYIFICDNKKLLDYIYNGDEVMEKVREDFGKYVNQLDEMLYYDPDELNRWAMEEKIEEEAEKRAIVLAEKKANEMAKTIAEDMAKNIAEDMIKSMLEEKSLILIEEMKEQNNKRQDEIIFNLYNKGLMASEISSILGVSEEEVFKSLNK